MRAFLTALKRGFSPFEKGGPGGFLEVRGHCRCRKSPLVPLFQRGEFSRKLDQCSSLYNPGTGWFTPRRSADPDHKRARCSRKALATTDTELKLMAAAAIMGDNSSPKTGYSTPAAIGTPRAL
jgi:hypothetical protein